MLPYLGSVSEKCERGNKRWFRERRDGLHGVDELLKDRLLHSWRDATSTASLDRRAVGAGLWVEPTVGNAWYNWFGEGRAYEGEEGEKGLKEHVE